MKIMLFNLCHGSDGNKKHTLKEQVDFINKHNPDVLLAQELDIRVPRSDFYDQFRYITYHTNLKGVFSKTISYQGGDYGLGFFAKSPFNHKKDLTLTESFKKERRKCQHIELTAHDKTYHLFNTHLPLYERERLTGVERIIHYIEQEKLENVIIGGDLNFGCEEIKRKHYDFKPLNEAPEFHLLNDRFKTTELSYKSFEHRGNQYLIDALFFSPTLTLNNFDVFQTNLTDHAILVYDLT